MTTATTSTAPAGQPRSAAAAEQLGAYEQRIRVPIVLSALLPLLVVPQQGHPVSVVIGIVTWLVFLVDYVVHRRLLQDYQRTRLGRFDLAIVVLTAPWFLLPGANAGGIVVLLRLARLVRLVVASRAATGLLRRLGRVGIVAASIMGVCALVAFFAERPVNPGFASFGDALWWAGVTLTTVGYGDIVPITSAGRFAGGALMVTGIAVLGVLAGSLASFLGLEHQREAAHADRAPTLDDVLAEVRALRATVERLEADQR